MNQLSDLGLTVISMVGHSQHNCGYCKGKDSSISFGIWAHAMTCEDYQRLIDRGWRRSGKYLYKPDLEKSCCPQYTIKLDSTRFVPSKSQKKVIHKFNRYVKGTWDPDPSTVDPQKKGKEPPFKKPNNYVEAANSLQHLIHDVENTSMDNKYDFKIELEPSSFTKEKFELYSKYQQHVHHDKPEERTEKGFKRFLVDSPLKAAPDGISYGSFHQKYILNGKLIALAVIDILPKCVSSVYFLYDPDDSFLGLGKYSVFREISLVQELYKRSKQLQYYYMGYYIHSCPKMNYKGQYQPSDLLDPVDYTWHPLKDFVTRFDQGQSFVTFHADGNNDSGQERRTYPPGWQDPSTLTDDMLEKVFVLVGQARMAPVTFLVQFESSLAFTQKIKDYVCSVGIELAQKFILC
ncbi:arginine-tRNA-protein transferase [Mycotypha africana]|uniref:arginine-tRNA-protein transferase n=1 Tax=Mycotypha africana TaxID=64632 RepID=UPI0023015051|nr:arginine-tRNA-protein transferase [Mycotypha africana]KAI8968857.1 arginine-tRNA-protein transferase [Mycotypha africana]